MSEVLLIIVMLPASLQRPATTVTFCAVRQKVAGSLSSISVLSVRYNEPPCMRVSHSDLKLRRGGGRMDARLQRCPEVGHCNGSICKTPKICM
jgi:hypothetical protein